MKIEMAGNPSKSGKMVVRLLRYISWALEEELAIQELAKMVSCYETHARHVFMQAVGLVSSDEGVAQIASELGYNSPQGFIKAIRRLFLQSPTEFRLGNRALKLEFPSCNRDFLRDPLSPGHEEVGFRIGYHITTLVYDGPRLNGRTPLKAL